MIKSSEFISKHRTSSKYFTRNRVWNFDVLFVFLCQFLNTRIQSEIDLYFPKILKNNSIVRYATSSSFCQQRSKILFTAFSDAIDKLNQFYYANFITKTFHGYRIIAVDGSIYTLPSSPELIEKFGRNLFRSKNKWVKSQVSFAWDVVNNICIDASIEHYKESERKLAIDHVKKIGGKNIYLFDRGYYSRDLLDELVESKAEYCFRVSSNCHKEVIRFIASNKTDSIVQIQTKKNLISLRLVKIPLKSGEIEILLTSLINSDFTKSKLKKLYHLRWNVEEAFKDMKHAICAENFNSKKVNSIKQEFFAKILMYNLSMMTCKAKIDKEVNKDRKEKKHKYKTNKRALLAMFKQRSASLFFQNYFQIKINIESIINLVIKESIPIRNNREYPRGSSYKVKKKHYRAYVPVC